LYLFVKSKAALPHQWLVNHRCGSFFCRLNGFFQFFLEILQYLYIIFSQLPNIIIRVGKVNGETLFGKGEYNN